MQGSPTLKVITLELDKPNINRRITLINKSLSISITALIYTFHEQ